MTTQEIIDELNAGRLYGHGNWWPTASGHFVAETPTTKIRMCLSEALREAEAIRRKRREIDLDAVMPLLEQIAKCDEGPFVWGEFDGGGTTRADVRAVVDAWKARRG